MFLNLFVDNSHSESIHSSENMHEWAREFNNTVDHITQQIASENIKTEFKKACTRLSQALGTDRALNGNVQGKLNNILNAIQDITNPSKNTKEESEGCDLFQTLQELVGAARNETEIYNERAITSIRQACVRIEEVVYDIAPNVSV